MNELIVHVSIVSGKPKALAFIKADRHVRDEQNQQSPSWHSRCKAERTISSLSFQRSAAISTKMASMIKSSVTHATFLTSATPVATYTRQLAKTIAPV